MKKIFRKLFLAKEIKSQAGVLHFQRWRILSTPWFGIFIHIIYKADEDAHMHDHPWNYISIVLAGFFTERVPDKKNPGKYEDRIVGSVTSVKRKAEDFHRIQAIHSKRIVTLFFIGRRRRDWGYKTASGWMQHEEYRKLKNGNKNK